MEEWQKKWIRQNGPKLYQFTTLTPSILAEFLANGFLSDDECMELKRIQKHADFGSTEYRATFYQFLMQKQGPVYDTLIQVLEAHTVSGAAQLLKDGQTAHLQQLQNEKCLQECEPADNLKDIVMELVKSCKALKVEVRSHEMCRTEGHYKLTQKAARYVLILNVAKFRSSCDRCGSETDVKYMIELWTGLGFVVFPEDPYKSWLTNSEIVQKIEEFKRKCSDDKAETCVVFIGSHGDSERILTSEEESVLVRQDIVYKFGSDDTTGCPSLEGVPKVFFFVSCQDFAHPPSDRLSIRQSKVDESGEMSQLIRKNHDVASAGSSSINVAETIITDALVVRFQTPCLPKKSDGRVGTWLVLVMTYVLMNYACCQTLQEMLGMIQNLVHQINTELTPEDRGKLSLSKDLTLKTLNLFPNQNT